MDNSQIKKLAELAGNNDISNHDELSIAPDGSPIKQADLTGTAEGLQTRDGYGGGYR